MVHLGPLPGSPRFADDFEQIIDSAVADAGTLERAGFRAAIVENFGDDPFFAGAVPSITVAGMTRVLAEVVRRTRMSIGVNVLRNDAIAALAIAAATGAEFIRVNVLSGLMMTDQGPVVGKAAEVARSRRSLCPQVRILADVHVKHAVPPVGVTIEQSARETWERAGADGLIVSGTGTGEATDPELVARVRKAVPDAPLYVGSGLTPDALADFAPVCDGAIVGTFLKLDGNAAARVDAQRAHEMVEAAQAAGW
jgi:membrane complex biogenesis BtpA family protein